jgi:lactosylceramide 4-alpha-galactosyltransferase
LYLYTFNAKSDKDYSFLLDQYPNLHIIQTSPAELFNNTPLMAWYEKGELFKSNYTISHLSDAGRYALLLKHGGVFSDMDTITLKSFQSLTQHNGAGYIYEGEDSLGSGVLVFHPVNSSFINFMVERFNKSYNPREWGSVGPILLKAAMKEYCRMKDIFNGLALEPQSFIKKQKARWRSSWKKCDLTVFPQRFFYPYNYEPLDFGTMFKKNSNLNTKRLADTFSVHFFGKISSEYKVKPGDYSIYDRLAYSHCQVVYEYVKLTGLLF